MSFADDLIFKLKECDQIRVIPGSSHLYEILQADKRFDGTIFRHYTSGKLLGSLIWNLRIPEEDGIPDEAYICMDYDGLVESINVDHFLANPLDCRVVDAFVLKIKRAFMVFLDILKTSEDTELVSKAYRFVYFLISDLKYQFGTKELEIDFDELLKTAIEHKNKVHRETLFRCLAVFIHGRCWPGYAEALNGFNISDLVLIFNSSSRNIFLTDMESFANSGRFPLDRRNLQLFIENLLRLSKHCPVGIQLLKNIMPLAISKKLDLDPFIGEMFQMYKGGVGSILEVFNCYWPKLTFWLKTMVDYLVEVENDLLSATEILNNVVHKPVDYIKQIVDRIMTSKYDEIAIRYLSNLTSWDGIMGYVLQNYPERVKAWMYLVKFCSVEQLKEFQKTIIPKIFENIDSDFGVNACIRLYELNPDLLSESLKFIPFFCKFNESEVLFDLVRQCNGENLVPYLPFLASYCLEQSTEDLILLLLEKVDINEFKSYSNIMWNIAKRMEYKTPLVLYLYQLEESESNFNRYFGVVRDYIENGNYPAEYFHLAVKILDHDSLQSLMTTVLNQSGNLLSCLEPLDYKKLQPFYDDLIPHLDNCAVEFKQVPSLLCLWRWYSVFPSNLEMKEIVWRVTMVFLEDAYDDGFVEHSEVFNDLLLLIGELINTVGQDIFYGIKMTFMFRNKIIDMFLGGLCADFSGISSVLIGMVTLGFDVPKLDLLISKCDEANLPIMVTINFIRDLAEIEAELFEPFAEKLIPFLSLYSSLTSETCTLISEAMEYLSELKPFKSNEWHYLLCN